MLQTESRRQQKDSRSPLFHSPVNRRAGTEPAVPDLARQFGNQAYSQTRSTTQIQAKLAVGSVDDPLEKEADLMAERMLGNSSCSPGSDCCSSCQNASPSIRRKANSTKDSNTPSVDSNQLSQEIGSGQALEQSQNRFFSEQFGFDFSHVRLHQNPGANAAASSLNARAFTFDRHIVFGKNQYQPGSRQGQKLLAHELTHVVQQSRPSQNTLVQREGPQEGGSTLTKLTREVFDKVLPIGRGIYLDIGGGITWGYPVHTGANVIIYIERRSKNIINIRSYKKGKVGLDTGVGAGLYIGSPNKPGGKKGAGLGLDAGANVEAGIAGTVIEEYQVPVSQFIQFAGQSLIDMSTGLPASPVKTFMGSGTGQYLTHRRLEAEGYGQAAAEAFAGLRRPGDDAATDKKKSGSVWGPKDERKSISSRPSVFDGDPLALLNFLSMAAGMAAKANVKAGLDQKFKGKDTVTSLFLEGEFRTMASVPIPGLNQILQMLPLGAGGGAEISFHQSPGKKTRRKISIYVKTGEDQVYQGSAHQQTFTFDITSMVSTADMLKAIQTHTLPPGINLSSIEKSFEAVNFWTRFSLLGPIGRNFNVFKRRQQGVRSLLSDKVQARARDIGVIFTPYLTLGLDMSGPDFVKISKMLWKTAVAAKKSTASSHDLKSTYTALQKFFSSYAKSKDFEGLIDTILDSTYVNFAELFIQYGVGIGVSGKLSKGAKIRGDLAVEGGLFCVMDYVKTLGTGGKIKLNDFLKKFQDVLNNPLKYMPDCPVLRALYSGGGNAHGSGGPGSGKSGGTGPVNKGVSGAQGKKRVAKPNKGGGKQDGKGMVKDYAVTDAYPEGLKTKSFTLQHLDGLSEDVVPGETYNVTMMVHSEPYFVVTVPLTVTRIENKKIYTKVAQSWWIEDLHIGSPVNEVYWFPVPRK